MDVRAISRLKKERFLRSLTEKKFRDEVLRPIFHRLGYQDGRELCGPLEEGKDTLFATKDKLGFTELTAVQTKRGKLNLAREAQQNVVEAITQLRTSLDTTVVMLRDRRKARPNRAILCASGTINSAARKHIVDEVGNPNIQFLDAIELIPLIDQHLPEFWLGIDADIQPYFRALEARVLGKPPGIEGELLVGVDVLSATPADENYVDLRLHKTIIRKRKQSGKTFEYPDIVQLSLRSLLHEHDQTLLILGEEGSGKTMSLLRLAFELAREGLTFSGRYTVPIFIRAVDVQRANPENLLEYLDDRARALSGSSKSCFTMDDLSGGHVLLLVDAIDELATDDDRRAVLRSINEFGERYPKVKIIVTSRPYRFAIELPELHRYAEYYVSPLDWRQAEQIFRRTQKGKDVPARMSQEALRRLEKIHGIALNPLLVTVFAAVTDVAKQDIPANITELFKRFTELMLGRWDERKGIKHLYQAPLKDHVVKRVAFHLHAQKVTGVSIGEFQSLVSKELEVLGHAPEGPQLTKEIVERSGLFKVVEGRLEFRHHLLQEFFAGRAIPGQEFIYKVVTDPWWQSALVFYFGENAAQVDALKETAAKLTGVSGGNMHQAAIAIGLANQACYLSSVSDKLDVWRWVVRALVGARDQTLSAEPVFQRIPLIAFTAYYLLSRDAVALMHLRTDLKTLSEWCKGDAFPDRGGKDAAMFWLIVGLIESGDVDLAEELALSFSPIDPRLLLAIHLGCHIAERIRPIEQKQKDSAHNVCRRLAAKISPYRKQLIKEWGSELVEMRKGLVANIEAEVDRKGGSEAQ